VFVDIISKYFSGLKLNEKHGLLKYFLFWQWWHSNLESSLFSLF